MNRRHDGHLHQHNKVVEVSRFLDANDEQCRHDENDEHGWQIKNRRHLGERCRISPRRFDLIQESRRCSQPIRLRIHQRRERGGKSINSVPRAADKRRRNINTEIVQERNDIARPADRDQ